jgi:pyruvate dehydrogenase E2 component (dihydrolipoamide acetyltransferase)
MPISILMPALSPTMTEGKLSRWLKAEGDSVKPGDVIAEIETDKATMEVEAVDEGKIGKILIASGTENVAVNTPIAVLLEEGESAVPAGFVAGGVTPANKSAPAAAPAPVAAAAVAAAPAPAVSGARILASPLARRIAEQKGVDLKVVKGSGPNGRIVKADVEKANPGAASRAPAPRTGAAPAVGVDARDLADKLGMRYTLQPNSGVRKVIARRLTESKQTVPHFYLSVDCELDRLLDLRQRLNSIDAGVKISVNDFVIRAVALALKQVPAANASWDEEAIMLYDQADISVAVATPGGLITPIVKAAESKTVQQISKEMKDLAARARDGKLRPEEFQGGGFSVSNLGMFGIKNFSAIINPPQGCILAVGAGEQRPVVKDGQLAIATVMSCTLSVDHRVVDGAVGAEFMAAFKKLIEEPFALVL